jgi:ABC-2 type transport system permease protein
VLFATTGEYATGTIRSTLQWVPNRNLLFVARTAVPVGFVTVSAVAISALTDLVAWANTSVAEILGLRPSP